MNASYHYAMTDKEQADAVLDGLRGFNVGDEVWVFTAANPWTIVRINDNWTAKIVKKDPGTYTVDNVPLRLLKHL